jgi:alpha-beta hydrolase superfamily lysophospholipase
LTNFLHAGYAVVATDYQGLGTGGVHQYVVGGTEARNALDSIKAAAALGPARASRRAVILGWSQGGGAALFVGQDASYGAPVKVLGLAALAPSADLGPQFAQQVAPGPTSPTAPAHEAALQINVYRGMLAAYPELRAAEVLTPEGIQALQGDGNQCIEHLADVIANNIAEPLSLFHTNVPPPWLRRINENTAGYAATVAPVLVMQGLADTVVNPNATTQYIARACAFRQPVQYSRYPGQTHQTIPYVAQSEYLTWIADRFAGRSAPSNCRASGG